MIIITEPLLADIEAKAKTATHGNWVYEEVPVYNKPARMVQSANGYSVADIGLPEDGDHIARMDPPTTLALVSAHRAALARIAELEEYIVFADEQAAMNEALADHATRWDGAKLSALELAARRDALEDALGRIAQERYADTEDAPDNGHHDGLSQGYDRSMRAVRSLLYAREIPGDPS